ncbi:hypothetical protein [Amycolatopsis sp. NPDC051903]
MPVRADLRPLDVLVVAVTGVAWATEEHGDQAQVDRLLDVMLDSYLAR